MNKKVKVLNVNVECVELLLGDKKISVPTVFAPQDIKSGDTLVIDENENKIIGKA